MENLTVGRAGEIMLPDDVRERYCLTPDTPLRIVETHSGILLVPLTGERAKDWPEGYFAATFGSCREEPLVRPSQGKADRRGVLR